MEKHKATRDRKTSISTNGLMAFIFRSTHFRLACGNDRYDFILVILIAILALNKS